MKLCYYQTPELLLRLESVEGLLTAIHFITGRTDQEDPDPVLTETARQLDDYFHGKRKSFQLPIALKGTPFQIKVWQALQTIPYGTTMSYQALSELIGSPKAMRAVGMANHCNPIAIVIPCHRVIGKNGSLTGYAGGLEIKKKLLELEKGFCYT
jgi:methylated-DNA-[protein]-cysteine S-methyltransferase